jgi:FHA domain/Bacterial regulatory proteins, luxR family
MEAADPHENENRPSGEGPTTESPVPTPADLKAVIEAERTGVPFVHWRTDEGMQQLVLLDTDQQRLTVGRRSDADVALAWDPEVSRAHALLERVGGSWTVVDDGLSRNGTFVNGGRIHGRHPLHDRDRLCFGRTHVIFREPPDPDQGASTAQAPGNHAAVPLSETQRKVLVALCRPVNDSTAATPATNRQIADELFLSVDAVKAHLRVLFERFGAADLPQNEKRARLAAQVLMDDVLKPHDF